MSLRGDAEALALDGDVANAAHQLLQDQALELDQDVVALLGMEGGVAEGDPVVGVVVQDRALTGIAGQRQLRGVAEDQVEGLVGLVQLVVQQGHGDGLFGLPGGEVERAAGRGEVHAAGCGGCGPVLRRAPVHAGRAFMVGPVQGYGELDGPVRLARPGVGDRYVRRNVVVVGNRGGR